MSQLKSNYPGLKEDITEGFDGYQEKVKELSNSNPNERIFVFFTGNDENNAGSWCPDCRNLEALLPKILPAVEPSGILLRVLVGNRPDWKSMTNPFRTDPKLHLTSIPTLIEFGTVRRLSDGDVENEKNLEMFFRLDD